MNGGAQRHRERSDCVGNTNLLDLTQCHRNRGGRRGCPQSGCVGGQHRDQSLERIDPEGQTTDQVQTDQDNDLQYQNQDDHHCQHGDNVVDLPGLCHVEEDTEDVNRQQGDDDFFNQLNDDGAELHKSTAQRAAGHHRQTDAHDNGQNERTQHGNRGGNLQSHRGGNVGSRRIRNGS